MKRFVNIVSLLALCLAVSGCFPFHYTTRPGLSGAVVSAESHAPLAGSVISFGRTNPTPVTCSAADGSFRVSPERQWGIWFIPMDVFLGEWSVCVHHRGYDTNCTQFLFNPATIGKSATMQLGVISLKAVLQ